MKILFQHLSILLSSSVSEDLLEIVTALHSALRKVFLHKSYLSTDSKVFGFVLNECFSFYVVDFLVYKLEAQETLNKGRVSHQS